MKHPNPTLQNSIAALSESVLNVQRRLALEVIAQWQAGEPPDPRAFFDRHPEHRWHKSVILDVVYEAYCLHIEAGEQLEIEDVCRQFPDLRQSLRRLVDVHGFMKSNLDVLSPTQPERWPAAGETPPAWQGAS